MALLACSVVSCDAEPQGNKSCRDESGDAPFRTELASDHTTQPTAFHHGVSDCTPPKPNGEVADLLAEISLSKEENADPSEYWVAGTWDLEGLRSDAALCKQERDFREEIELAALRENLQHAISKADGLSSKLAPAGDLILDSEDEMSVSPPNENSDGNIGSAAQHSNGEAKQSVMVQIPGEVRNESMIVDDLSVTTMETAGVAATEDGLKAAVLAADHVPSAATEQESQLSRENPQDAGVVAADSCTSADMQAEVISDEESNCVADHGGKSMEKESSREEMEWSCHCRFRICDGLVTFSASMTKCQLGDAGTRRWCTWMTKRFEVILAASDPKRKPTIRAQLLDFSSNDIGEDGIRSLCELLESQRIRCAVLRLHDNRINDGGMYELARYLTCFNPAPVLELHLSHNRISSRGILWMIASLAQHPAFPLHDQVRHAYVPLWVRLDHNAMTTCEAEALLSAALKPLHVTACLASCAQECSAARCKCMRAKGVLKHNCIIHLPKFLQQDEQSQTTLPILEPELNASPLFECKQTFIPWPGKAGEQEVEASSSRRGEPLILYDDSDIAVLLKPSGWLCTVEGTDVDPASWPRQRRRKAAFELQSQASPAPLSQYLLLRYGLSAHLLRDSRQFGLVHRLDLETSGPVLVGRTKKGFEAARAQMRARTVIKDYVALVHGSLGAAGNRELRAPIDDSTYSAKSVCRVHPDGRDAITICEAVGEYTDAWDTYTLLRMRLVTGRTHQARVHMAHIGHPIVSDSHYTNDTSVLKRDRAFCPRLFLHKVRVGFSGLGGEPVVVNSPLTMAPELVRALAKLTPSKIFSA